jgi:hypothetical protein
MAQMTPTALARMLTTEPEPATCTTTLDALEAYVTAQLAADTATAAARYPAVALHLDACVACAESYALLYDALAVPVAQPARVPAPDLSFLPRPGLLQRVGAALVLQLSQVLQSAPPLAGALRSGGAPLFDLHLGTPDAALSELRITVYPRPQAADRCDLRVLVVPIGRAWPQLAGTTVTLSAGAALQHEQTDQYGEVVFADRSIDALAALELRITVMNA